MHRIALFILASSFLTACPSGYLFAKDDSAASLPDAGLATLEARTLNDDYVAATLSIEYATVEETGVVNNDWDLLFGNDQEPGYDEFSVNMVTDDVSAIFDLGPMGLGAVPATVDPGSFPVDDQGLHDNVRVQEGNAYFIHTVDSNTDMYGAVLVRSLTLNNQVQVAWCRSVRDDGFEASAECLAL